MNVAHAILVTRPGAAGAALAAALQAQGATALWLPAFELLPAPDPAQVRSVLARLHEFDLAVFVSPAAVHAIAPQFPQPWPATTVLGVVGQGTARAVREQLPPGAAPELIEPDAALAGSEALWQALQQRRAGAASPWPQRVLLLRAESGREWLADQLHAIGAHVEVLAVYRRRACEPGAPVLAALDDLARESRPFATLLTSSEALAVLDTQLASRPALRAAVRGGVALASHARIAAAARAAGFADVRVVVPDAAQIAAALVA